MERGRGDSATRYPGSLSSPRMLGGAEFWGSIRQRTPLGVSGVLCPRGGPLKGELKRKWGWPGVVQPPDRGAGCARLEESQGGSQVMVVSPDWCLLFVNNCVHFIVNNAGYETGSVVCQERMAKPWQEATDQNSCSKGVWKYLASPVQRNGGRACASWPPPPWKAPPIFQERQGDKGEPIWVFESIWKGFPVPQISTQLSLPSKS